MEIPFRIGKIETKQFAIFTEHFENKKDIATKIDTVFGINREQTDIRCKVSIECKQQDSLVLMLEIICYFDIATEGWKEMQHKEEWRIPVPFLQYMANITIGAARGVIHTKTEGTVLNAFILPPLDLSNVIKQDYIIKKEGLPEE